MHRKNYTPSKAKTTEGSIYQGDNLYILKL
jgi:hypothetical protein